MQTYKKIIISLFVASVIYSAFVLTVDTVHKHKLQTQEQKQEISTESESYKIKAHNGKIAVFIEGENLPLYTLDSPLLTDLPEYDRKLLTYGIIAENNAELLRILEDYDN